ncbi:hypothetical protein F7018_01075 [Tenacibaculum aiptasiae]|uniref:META domain-containing protein n=1 Tax=Tenacibaculum aiptasiae TaxID=426481 RepID=A0A7J5AS95_9FLAO|nr:hypothetical protein [Tenacibaculum aiptasiae]KAB1160498.1 hypothetical protein F7018_01075 [Tenacibaculum aiptasiae]
MKRIVLILTTIGILFSCDNDHELNSNVELVGNWKLIEVLADPGNGSGTFKAVESNKTIEFKANGTITTNGSLCNPYSKEIISSGTYSNNTITTNCQNSNIATIGFELKRQFLILSFISNEGYYQKFEKIN